MAGHRRESLVRVQIPARVVVRIFHHKVAARDPQVKDSAIRPLQQARVHMSVGDLSIDHRLPAGLRVKQEAQEKEGRALMVNLAVRRHQEAERPRREPNAVKSSRNTERNNPRKERRDPARNNSTVEFVIAAPEIKIPEPLFFCSRASVPFNAESADPI
jgi:hypothetical protein